MVGNGKRRWVLPFTRSGSSKCDPKPNLEDPPRELICPILGSLMSDPVVVSSGQSFERVAVQACRDLGFSPALDDGSRPDFSALIPNCALQKTILSWCEKSGAGCPRPPDYSWAAGLIRAKISQPSSLIRPSERELLRGVAENPPLLIPYAVSEVTQRVNRFHSGSSEESMMVGVASPGTPLPLTTRPLCYSSRSSSDLREDEALASEPVLNPNPDEEELISKLTSEEVLEQEKGAIQLRRITRLRAESRSPLCTRRLIAALKPLLSSRYSSVQVNACASMVNLSLENSNKVEIVRLGVVPLLIDVLKGGSGESQEHGAGALFSLALDDDNKTAIGVLGALPPLLHALRSESERTRHDSALALYNLTLVQSNRIKLIKLSAIPTLLAMVKSGSLASRVLLILCNLAACTEGKSAMLDSNAVGIFVGLLRENQVDSEAIRENCVAALYALSHGSLRFKGLARDVKAMEVLREVEERGTDRAREKAKRLLEVMRGREGREEEDLYQALPMESDVTYRARYRPGGRNLHNANSTNF
ncbi:U-box domain-containing protein 38-like [Punica granatum]|uniref:RING-type E3 ubiquitin transferase n=2 Tax=Punica granatum TaxID=22663 RepID=A0A218VZB7_PUNGR|nr:U-box domain-containing protein 38-like [Punica granatum]OWM65371.1 hypothetical protein CDL15_Pgr008961 [Punica granatum]PKI34914.1 hypothetical protein CRG98_044694 [Punica granatum]